MLEEPTMIELIIHAFKNAHAHCLTATKVLEEVTFIDPLGRTFNKGSIATYLHKLMNIKVLRKESDVYIMNEDCLEVTIQDIKLRFSDYLKNVRKSQKKIQKNSQPVKDGRRKTDRVVYKNLDINNTIDALASQLKIIISEATGDKRVIIEISEDNKITEGTITNNRDFAASFKISTFKEDSEF